MKEIFDWLREEIRSYSCDVDTFSGKVVKSLDTEDALEAITEAEVKLKEKEAELRANVIEEFAEKLKREEVYVDVTSDDMVYVKYCRYIEEIASKMKGEKE